MNIKFRRHDTDKSLTTLLLEHKGTLFTRVCQRHSEFDAYRKMRSEVMDEPKKEHGCGRSN